ncbi:hypothetical protein C7293_31490, partial [filamentous cyanobacterium CCT1]
AAQVNDDIPLKAVLAAMAAAGQSQALVTHQDQVLGVVSFAELPLGTDANPLDLSALKAESLPSVGLTCQLEAYAHVPPMPIQPVVPTASPTALPMARLQQVLQGAGLGIWDWDLQTQQVTCSAELEFLLGLEPNSFDGRYETFLQLIRLGDSLHEPTSGTQIDLYFQTILRQCKHYQLKFSVVHGNGAVRYLLMQGQVFYQGEKPCRMTGLVFDITAHCQAEAALKRHHERQQIISEMAQKIRHSLQLESVLEQAVLAMRQFLQADRAIVMRCLADGGGQVIQETVDGRFDSMMDWRLRSTWGLRPDHQARLSQGLGLAINDIKAESPSAAEIEFAEFFGICSEVIFPLMQDDRLWGLLIAHQCDRPRTWDHSDIQLLETLATQVGIAIQQAKLHEKLRYANDQLQRLVFIDELTQVSNRRQFEEHLEQEWRRLCREQSPISLLMCDIDHFKQYNDTYGHPAGDRCLASVAQAISDIVKRPADLVARYGGEEFAVILPNTDQAGAESIAEEIHFAVRRLRIPHRRSPSDKIITLSIGVATSMPIAASYRQGLVENADRALYQAKAAGRNCIIVAKPSPSES